MAAFFRRICCCLTDGIASRCPGKLLTPKRVILWLWVSTLLVMYFMYEPFGLTSRLIKKYTIRDTLYREASAELQKHSLPLEKLGTWTPKTPNSSDDRAQNYICSFQRVFHLTSTREVYLNAEPFLGYTAGMRCLSKGHIAVFKDKFARLDNVIIDPSKESGNRNGGEAILEVTNQEEKNEYLTLKPGFFSAPCETVPSLTFDRKNHLSIWAQVLTCYNDKASVEKVNGLVSSFNSTSTVPKLEGTTIVIQRYEYANLYCAMTEFYNTFVMMMLTGTDPSHVTSVLLVDAHPQGNLDSAWDHLYTHTIRAKHLQRPTMFSKVVWSLISYNSPLWNVQNPSVPYLAEFRHFFLSRHNAKTDHVIDCSQLNAVIIWRRDYVAHPRNPSGIIARKFTNEEDILSQVRKTLGPKANVTGVQLDKLSMADQVRLISTCDILIGMHGAGLAHVMLLASTSGFIEIFPPSIRPSNTHFQAIAKWRKLTTVRFHNTGMANEQPHKTTKIDLNLLDSHVLKLKGALSCT